jgi:hypothetical protein
MPDKKVAHLNIAHFRKLLAAELDESKRKTILHLLAEEEAKEASRQRNLAKKDKA